MRGYFSSLEEWFVKDEKGNRFIQIGTIRDLMDRFEIKGARLSVNPKRKHGTEESY